MEEQLDLFSFSTPKFKIDKPIRLIELFAGIGSQAAALRNLGADFTHYRCVEWDKYAMASYNAIHGTNFETSDIQMIHADDLGIEETDKYYYIMTYSFPCQDLSLAGNQKGMTKGSGTRSGLLWEVERILDECEELPQVLLMENVPQVIGNKNIKDFQSWRSKLESLGYSNYVQLLNAKDYGIPQNRNRCFMVSLLGDWHYTFPVKQKLELRLKDMLEDKVDEKYYLSDEVIKKFVVNNKNNDVGYIEKGTGQHQSNTIYSADGCSRTIQATDWKDPQLVSHAIRGGNHLGNIMENVRIRKLTPKECWRLMGFSDEDFEKAKQVNSDSQLYKEAGNSIVVNVLMAIFKEML